MSFPNFNELKEFIKNNQKATICEIRDKFNQKGEDIVSIMNGNKKCDLAYSINAPFFEHLQEFMKNDYVIVQEDALCCLVSDKTKYIGKGHFLPIVLSIK